MSDSASQNDVDSLVSQLQADNTALAAETKSVDDAAQQAAELASEIHSAEGAVPPLQTPPDAAGTGPKHAAHAPPIEGTVAPASVVVEAAPDVHRLLAIDVPVIVQLGVRRMTVGEVMRFAVGAIIEFSKSAEEELELLVNNKPVGKGHAVKVSENFGIKLTRIGSVKETIRKLGAA